SWPQSYGRKVMGQSHGRKVMRPNSRLLKSSRGRRAYARCALARERGAAAAYRRHDELVAAAGARVDVGAGTEAQVLAGANAAPAQAPAAAGPRDAVAAKAGIDLHERLLDLVGRDRERRARRDIGIGDLHRRARLAHVLEIGVRAQPRAGAVAVPLVEDQARRRHQI